MNSPVRMQYRNRLLSLWFAPACLIVAGCTTSLSAPIKGQQVHMPLKQGWFEGQVVFYVTTDASDAGAAKNLEANFSPRLAYALPSATIEKSARQPPSSVDKVYAFPNFAQNNVFASAPKPVGYQSTESAYTPIWLMMTVTWKAGATPSALTSEEAVLDAAEKGLVLVASTGVVVNCPIVHRGADGGLPGVTMTR